MKLSLIFFFFFFFLLKMYIVPQKRQQGMVFGQELLQALLVVSRFGFFV